VSGARALARAAIAAGIATDPDEKEAALRAAERVLSRWRPARRLALLRGLAAVVEAAPRPDRDIPPQATGDAARDCGGLGIGDASGVTSAPPHQPGAGERANGVAAARASAPSRRPDG
jgi:hypothetical protein